MNVYKMIRTIIVITILLLLVATVSCSNDKHKPTWSTSTGVDPYTIVYVDAPSGNGCRSADTIIYILQNVLDDYKHRGYRPLSITTTASTSGGFHCGYIILMEYVGDDYLP